MRSLLFAVPLLLAACTTAHAPRVTAVEPMLDDPLVGTQPQEWKADEWLNTPPRKLADLRGNVVLVRWFMGTACPMCSATAASLKQLQHDYASRGLVVVGMYHHKDEDQPLSRELVERYAHDYGFTFPIAIDRDWRTLKSWWLTKERPFTSVSFILDKQGRIRAVHRGGRYAPGEPEYEAVRRAVERLLDEPG